jgi:hypothetical protein
MEEAVIQEEPLPPEEKKEEKEQRGVVEISFSPAPDNIAPTSFSI